MYCGILVFFVDLQVLYYGIFSIKKEQITGIKKDTTEKAEKCMNRYLFFKHLWLKVPSLISWYFYDTFYNFN